MKSGNVTAVRLHYFCRARLLPLPLRGTCLLGAACHARQKMDGTVGGLLNAYLKMVNDARPACSVLVDRYIQSLTRCGGGLEFKD